MPLTAAVDAKALIRHRLASAVVYSVLSGLLGTLAGVIPNIFIGFPAF